MNFPDSIRNSSTFIRNAVSDSLLNVRQSFATIPKGLVRRRKAEWDQQGHDLDDPEAGNKHAKCLSPAAARPRTPPGSPHSEPERYSLCGDEFQTSPEPKRSSTFMYAFDVFHFRKEHGGTHLSGFDHTMDLEIGSPWEVECYFGLVVGVRSWGSH